MPVGLTFKARTRHRRAGDQPSSSWEPGPLSHGPGTASTQEGWLVILGITNPGLRARPRQRTSAPRWHSRSPAARYTPPRSSQSQRLPPQARHGSCPQPGYPQQTARPGNYAGYPPARDHRRGRAAPAGRNLRRERPEGRAEPSPGRGLPGGWDGQSAEEAEEPAHLLDQRLRLLQRGEVATSRQFLEPAQVGEPQLGLPPRRAGYIAWVDRQPGRRGDLVPEAGQLSQYRRAADVADAVNQ